MEHINIPDSQLHEPKGAANAVSGAFYRSNGTGSGNWGKLTSDNVEGMPSSPPSGELVVTDGGGGFSTKPLPLTGEEVTVTPGTQILQSYLNSLVSRIDDLEARIETLEGSP